MEEWKVYLENYEVSNFGNIKRKLQNGLTREIKCSIQNKGYKYFQIKRLGKRQNHLIHQVVAKLFIGERPEGLVIDHIDRNSLNNNVSNLRYITQKENCFNHDRVYTHIPQDTENRQYLVSKEWRAKHKNTLKKKKKEYMEKNKELIQQKYKSLRFPITCSHCNIERQILESQRNMLRRENRMETNLCTVCNTKKTNGVL